MQFLPTFIEPHLIFYIRKIPPHTTKQKCHKTYICNEIQWSSSFNLLVKPGAGLLNTTLIYSQELKKTFFKPFKWNWIIFQDIPDDLSWHTNEPQQCSGTIGLMYCSQCGWNLPPSPNCSVLVEWLPLQYCRSQCTPETTSRFDFFFF